MITHLYRPMYGSANGPSQRQNQKSNLHRRLRSNDYKIDPTENCKVQRTVGYECQELFSSETVLARNELISEGKEDIARNNADESDIDGFRAREPEHLAQLVQISDGLFFDIPCILHQFNHDRGSICQLFGLV